jgi:hypothetical protein
MLQSFNWSFFKKYYFFVSNHSAPKNVKIESQFFRGQRQEIKNLTLSGISGGLVSATTLSITTVSIRTLSIMTSCIILSVAYSEHRVFHIVKLGVIKLSVIVLTVVVTSVIVRNVVAPIFLPKTFKAQVNILSISQCQVAVWTLGCRIMGRMFCHCASLNSSEPF